MPPDKDFQQITRPCVTHHHACDCREAAHAAEVRQLRSLLADAISDIAEQCDATYMTRDKHPDQMRRYDRDMEIVRKARTLLDGVEA